MKTRWKILRVAGIDIFLHATFPLLLVWVALSRFVQGGTFEGIGATLAFVVLLFSAIGLHELAHAVVARRFGILTRDITLLPIGGIARLERLPEKPGEELLVALAGPAANVALALLLGALASIWIMRAGSASFLADLARANLWLAAFNLLPVFPLDGGRVLRALLGMRYGHLQATQLAAKIGRVGALLIGFVGLIWNPFLVLIAVFVWLGAATEAEATQLHESVAGLRMEQVMLREYLTFAPGETLARATNHLLASTQEDFPVVDDERRLLGVLRRSGLIRGLAERGPDARVDEIMQRHPRTAPVNESVQHLLRRWTPSDGAVLVLQSGHQLAGMFTPTNLAEFLLVQNALQKHADIPVPGALSPDVR